MSDYQDVVTVNSLSELTNVVTDYQLKAGDRVRLALHVMPGMGYVFNVAGAELAFSPFMPPHMNLIDVYGSGDIGYVEMEATSPPLAAVLAFIGTYWLDIILVGVVIASIIILCVVATKLVQGITSIPNLVLLGLAVLGGVWFFTRNKGSTKAKSP